MTMQLILTHWYKIIMILVITIVTSKLLVENYKLKSNLNPPNMDFIFERRHNTYNLRNFQQFAMK